MKHLLKLLDLSGQEIIEILNLADQLKYELKHGISHPYLKDQTLGMIFQKSSTRTRVSFQVGMGQLGGSALFLSSRDLQIGRGEAVEDTARVLSRYLDGIMIRTFAQEEVEDLAKYGSIPIINGLTDFCHPCQVLADLLTVREYKGSLEGLNLCYIGDGNNMANSLIVGGLKVGMKVSVATPGDYQPDAQVLAFAKGYPGQFKLVSSPKEAAAGADVVGGRSRTAQKGVRGLSDQRRTAPGMCAGCDGAALPARAPGRGDHRRGVRGARQRDFRRGGKPSARPEGSIGQDNGKGLPEGAFGINCAVLPPCKSGPDTQYPGRLFCPHWSKTHIFKGMH